MWRAPEADSQRMVFQVPLTTFLLQEPEDSYPCYQEWQVHATSIFTTAFEPWRENIEVKVWEDSTLGQPLSFGSLGPAKGFGRLSILFFGVLYTYLEMQKKWDAETETAFQKYTGCRDGTFYSSCIPGLVARDLGGTLARNKLGSGPEHPHHISLSSTRVKPANPHLLALCRRRWLGRLATSYKPSPVWPCAGDDGLED